MSSEQMERELLELAAKAAGLRFDLFIDGRTIRRDADGQPIYWNPLADDGDALRLAAQLHLYIDLHDDLEVIVCCPDLDMPEFQQPLGHDPMIATRRAIVRAAAAIGRDMP